MAYKSKGGGDFFYHNDLRGTKSIRNCTEGMEGPGLHSAAKNQSSAHFLLWSALALSMTFWVHSVMVSAIVQ